MLSTDLTAREREVLLLAAEGLSDKQIAEKLQIGRGTVMSLWTRIRERTGSASRTQAVAVELLRVFRATEAELMRTSGVYRALVETLEDFAVFLLDHDRTLLSWNPGVGKILGYAEEEWIGQAADIIFSPQDREARIPQIEQEQSAREGRALDDRWHVRKDGSLFWASGVMVGVRAEAGELICYSKVLRDLTRLKRVEEEVTRLGGDPTLL